MDGVCPFVDWKPVDTNCYSVGGQPKVGFCDHTAGGFYRTLSNPEFWNNLGIGVHFALGRDGSACQLVNIFDRAYGQGRDAFNNPVGPNSPGITWPPFEAMNKTNPNEYLISLEHEDAILVDGKVRFVPGSEWTPEQYQKDLEIKRWCQEEIRRVSGQELLKFGKDSLAGHYMFDPVSRAECPGKFWRQKYQSELWRDLSGEEDMFTIWSYGGTVEIENLLQGGISAPSLRQLLGLPQEQNDWDLEFSVVGDIVIYHGIPDANNRRAARVRGNDSLARVRLSDNTGACYIQCIAPNTRVWVTARGFHTPQAVW